MIDTQKYKIPEGIEKIVIGEVDEIDKEKYTTDFREILKSSSPETPYLISVFVKPENEKEMDLKLNDIAKTRENRKQMDEIIDNAYRNNMNSFREYVNSHAIGKANFLGRLYGASCEMKTKDILELMSKEYFGHLMRADI